MSKNNKATKPAVNATANDQNHSPAVLLAAIYNAANDAANANGKAWITTLELVNELIEGTITPESTKAAKIKAAEELHGYMENYNINKREGAGKTLSNYASLLRKSAELGTDLQSSVAATTKVNAAAKPAPEREPEAPKPEGDKGVSVLQAAYALILSSVKSMSNGELEALLNAINSELDTRQAASAQAEQQQEKAVEGERVYEQDNANVVAFIGPVAPVNAEKPQKAHKKGRKNAA